jgi:methylmalonyl-CoA/ethylmalonyl-CoA epimerase
MPALKLHHVGIVQPTEQDALEFMALLGMEEDYRGYVDQWQCLCIFARSASASTIEFIVPTGGVLTKFNKGAGGLHHVALEVPDLDAARVPLEAAGLRFLEKSHVKGAGDFMCNFVSPVHTRGIQIEFVQLLDARRHDPQ